MAIIQGGVSIVEVMTSLLMKELSPLRFLLMGDLLRFELEQPLVFYVAPHLIDLLLAFDAIP